MKLEIQGSFVSSALRFCSQRFCRWGSSKEKKNYIHLQNGKLRKLFYWVKGYDIKGHFLYLN